VNVLRSLGPLELVIILAIVILIFGVGRLGKIGSELGRGIRNFRQALSGQEGEEEPSELDEGQR
jgi:sec-independent protein translocase protein TatA